MHQLLVCARIIRVYFRHRCVYIFISPGQMLVKLFTTGLPSQPSAWLRFHLFVLTHPVCILISYASVHVINSYVLEILIVTYYTLCDPGLLASVKIERCMYGQVNTVLISFTDRSVRKIKTRLIFKVFAFYW